VLRASLVRPGRTVLQVVALVSAVGATTALLNLYDDAEAKLRRQTAAYGANLVVEPLAGHALEASSLRAIDSIIGAESVAVPLVLLDGVVAGNGSVVVAATDFRRSRRLSEWWSVSAWPSAPGDALVGVRSMPALPKQGAQLSVDVAGVARGWRAVGTLTCGSIEDQRIYVAIDDLDPRQARSLTSVSVGVVGTAAEVESARARIAAAIPAAEVRVLRQVATGSEHVLKKARLVLLAALTMIILTAALCVFATSSAAVFERRKDAAVMKALGASARMVWALFGAEAALVGVVASVPGFLLGVAAAGAIARTSFEAPMQANWALYPLILAGCLAVVVGSAAVPIELLRRVDPAVHLKGE
jgi:putative ABC transport system permease protein